MATSPRARGTGRGLTASAQSFRNLSARAGDSRSRNPSGGRRVQPLRARGGQPEPVQAHPRGMTTSPRARGTAAGGFSMVEMSGQPLRARGGQPREGTQDSRRNPTSPRARGTAKQLLDLRLSFANLSARAGDRFVVFDTLTYAPKPLRARGGQPREGTQDSRRNPTSPRARGTAFKPVARNWRLANLSARAGDSLAQGGITDSLAVGETGERPGLERAQSGARVRFASCGKIQHQALYQSSRCAPS